MIKEAVYELLEKIGCYTAASDVSAKNGEEQTFMDFARTLEDGIIVSKVTTEPKKYSGFVCD